MNTINGIPLVFDDGQDRDIFGSLFPSEFNNYNSNFIQPNSTNNEQNEAYVNPLLKKHLRADGIPIKTEEKISQFEHKAFYNVSFIVFDKGSNMLNAHNDKKPNKNELVIFYEQDSDTNSNLFGSFVLVKMGDGYFEYLRDLKQKKTKIFSHVGQSPKGVIIDSFEKEVNENYKALLTRTKQISKETFLFALETEMRTNSNEGKMLKSIFGGLDGVIAGAVEGINTAIEEVKFTKEDYTPPKKEGDFNLADFLEKFVEVNQEILEKAVDYAIPDAIEKQLSKSFDDFVKGAKQLAKEKLAPETIRFFEKVYKIFQSTLSFFKETASFFASLVGDTLYLVKAFIMGVINGLLSTIQMIVSLVGWLLKGNIDKKMTGQFYLEIQSKFEFIEDLIDLVSESIGDVFTSIKNLIKDFSLEKIKGVLSIFKDKAGKINRFDVAYFAGIFIFEVILGVILVVFTGGAAAIAEATNAAEKIAAFLKIFGREVLSTATMGIVDILKLFRILILKFAQACQKGWKGFKRFLENLFKNKVDDVAKSEGRVLDEADEFSDIAKSFQKGGGDINKTFAENAGIRIEKYLTEFKVFGQTTGHTCAATSLKMVLDDKGIVKSEHYLAEALRTDKNGASILDIPDALFYSYLDDINTIAEKDIKFSKLMESLKEGDKAIVSVWTDQFKGHAVVLEKIENGLVFLRDPLPINHGASYSITVESFEEIFNKKAVIIKK